MALELSTAGIVVKYSIGVESTRPSASYVAIPGVKSIPEFGKTVNTIQSTPLSATKNHTYVEGLGDTGGAVSLTVNDYPAFRTAWETMISSYESSVSANKCVWVEYAIPGLTDSFYYPATPTALGFGGAEVDAVLENAANFIPVGDYLWAAKST